MADAVVAMSPASAASHHLPTQALPPSLHGASSPVSRTQHTMPPSSLANEPKSSDDLQAAIDDSSQAEKQVATDAAKEEAPASPATRAAAAASTADNANSRAPSPLPAQSPQPSPSTGLDHDSNGLDDESATTVKTSPSPEASQKPDLPRVRKPLPAASPDSSDPPTYPADHLDSTDRPQHHGEGGFENNEDNPLASLPAEESRDAHDEIIVSAGQGAASTPLSRATPAVDEEDDIMLDVEEDEDPIPSHYPKRKRTSVFPDLDEDKLENTKGGRDGTQSTPDLPDNGSKPPRQTVGNAKGVVLGFWRDSTVPDDANKHAVIGFIDVRDRLRTRIQSVDRDGARIAAEHSLGPGPGNCWVTFDKVAYSPHLVGLDSVAIKEYVRIRAGQVDTDDDQRIENEHMAVDIAWEKVKTQYRIDDRADLPVKASQIAYGAEIPPAHHGTSRAESKRRKTSGFFNAIDPDGSNGVGGDSPMAQRATLTLDPLEGHRPTSILIGHWTKSTVEGRPCSAGNSHAVFGVLGQNDMFRPKLLRQTKDGRFLDGNFPAGAGALWIAYEEVQLINHLAQHSRSEVKEYCRIRQYQIDHGETLEQVTENELRAAEDAKVRVATMFPNQPASTPLVGNRHASGTIEPALAGPEEYETRQSSRTGLRRESRTSRHDHLPTRSQQRHLQSEEAVERSNSIAQSELAKAEAAQYRNSRYSLNRERAAAAADEETAQAVAAAMAATRAASGMPPPLSSAVARSAPTGTARPFPNMSESAQRLNGVWASQEVQRARAARDDDVKIHDGVKFERKMMGPFIGKLTSPGTLVNIDGEDFVEYRVLARPSFF